MGFFFSFLFLPPFYHPHYLKAGVTPRGLPPPEKKEKKLFEKVSILLQKAPNLGRFKKDLEKK